VTRAIAIYGGGDAHKKCMLYEEKKALLSERRAKSQNWNCVYAPCDVLEQGQWRMKQEKFELENDCPRLALQIES
jgi:hypothetical protein